MVKWVASAIRRLLDSIECIPSRVAGSKPATRTGWKPVAQCGYCRNPGDRHAYPPRKGPGRV